MVSSEAGPDLAARVQRLGNAVFIPKPVEIERLARAIRVAAERVR